MSIPIIVWFRRDLRLHDNPALRSAHDEGGPVIPVYVYAPEEEEPWRPGAASRWWLHHSLGALDASLGAVGFPLLILRGDTSSTLMMLCRRTRARAVYWNRLYDPAVVARDARVETVLRKIGVETRSFPGYLLREPGEVMTAAGTPYKVFTPYSHAVFRLGDPPEAVAAPSGQASSEHGVDSEGVDALRLLPRIRWDTGLREAWQPGEAGAWQRAEAFVTPDDFDYAGSRDRPDRDGISRLSPHLHFGEISPRALWHALMRSLAGRGREEEAFAYLRQLLWRDFAHQLLFHFPRITEDNFKPAFDAFPWRSDPALLEAWHRGETGIPLIDAGMRELWHTGFMHNRVRMNVASFLTKNAGIDWRIGARWFWDTLVDANLANNTLGWQWVTGSGPDAAPYFRIFNPVTQSRRFDPNGTYIRHWVPALSSLPARYVHSPWTAPKAVLDKAGVRVGKDYPSPVVDLKASRQRALDAYKRSVAVLGYPR
ncbi:MAG: deoxyribodipyrimidine photo-lyase [Arenicellales bacterium]